jgi:itaconate CoA-transferase
MDVTSLYASKLTTPEKAVAGIPSGSRFSMGMAVAQPPGLLKALADRAAAGGVEDLKADY